MRNLAASAVIFLTLSGVGPAAAEPYRLHAQDRVLVRVAAWNFDQNGITEWGGISGEYLIAPDGMLQFPMVGAITAEGQTLTELQHELATILRRNAGLDQPPNLTVELVEGLPVYVLGAAQTRGAVEFRPGLTPRQALALAGGVYRTAGAADLMQIARIAGDAKLATDELHRQQAERTAVEAQLAALDLPDPPPTTPLPPDADLRARMQAADQTARQAQVASLESLQQLLAEKSDKLRQQIVLRDQQLADYRRDLEDMSELKEKGLAVNARVTALTSSINDIETKRLDLEATVLLAEQQLNETERTRAAITNDARSANLQRLAELEAEMAATSIQLDTTAQLLTQATLAGELAAEENANAAQEPGFIVTRTVDGVAERITAAPDMALEPGDVLEVTLPPVPPRSALPSASTPAPAAAALDQIAFTAVPAADK